MLILADNKNHRPNFFPRFYRNQVTETTAYKRNLTKSIEKRRFQRLEFMICNSKARTIVNQKMKFDFYRTFNNADSKNSIHVESILKFVLLKFWTATTENVTGNHFLWQTFQFCLEIHFQGTLAKSSTSVYFLLQDPWLCENSKNIFR